jgi:hypothetical protein
MEGGNAAADEAGDWTKADDLSLLSCYHRPDESHFAPFEETSAATALAARMAARLQAVYPTAWPETIRGLIVHSAEWTEPMAQRFVMNGSKSEYGQLLRYCGYGVPNFVRARESASDSLTLVSEQEIQPYDRKDGRYVTKDMHVHELPWPRDVLLGLGDLEVTMRVTLSYFVEPSPGEIGWRDRYRYQSHALRFDVNTPDESRREFLARLNREARDDEGTQGAGGASDRWLIGKTLRNRGSVHSDVLRGSAADIATSNLVGVYPVIGWWRERHHLGRWARKARYSLIVSVHTPEAEVDIYTPVAVQLGIQVPIEIRTE